MKEHTERAGKCSLSILVDRRNAYVILILSLSSVWNSASRMILSKSLPNMLPIPGGNCIKIGLSGKSILRDYFQENRTSQRPFLLLRISFPGRPIFIQFIPGTNMATYSTATAVNDAHRK